MHNTSPRHFTWTANTVAAFWSMFTKTPLTRLSFSRLARAELVRLVSAFATPGVRVLDFGGGSGDLAEGLLQAGFQVGVYEPAEGRRQDLVAKNIATHENWLGFFGPASRAQFDIVCAFEVMEHFLDETFSADMALLAGFCAPGGQVIGTVPLEEDLEQNLCLCPECGSVFHKWQHQRSFSRESLAAKLRDSGLAHCHTFVIDFSICLGFAAGFRDFTLPEAHIAAPQTLSEALTTARSEAPGLRAECAALRQQAEALGREHDQLSREHERLGREHDQLSREHERLGREHGQLSREHERLERAHDQLVATLGEDNLETLKHNAFAAHLLGHALRRVGRISHRIPGFSFFIRGGKKLLRPALNMRRNCERDCYEPETVREMTEDWPTAAHFLPPRPPSPRAQAGKPDVLLITSTLSAGGAERQVVNLALHLHNAGHRVRVRLQSLAGADAHYAPFLQKAGLDYRDLYGENMEKNVSRLAGAGVDLALLHALPPALRQATAALAVEALREPADIIHAFLDTANIMAGWAGFLAGTPAMRLSCRNLNPSHFHFYQSWMDSHYQWLARQPRIALEANSRAGARDYEAWLGLPEDCIEVCPNGIDPAQAVILSATERQQLRAKLKITRDAPLVMAVCRISQEKRPLDLMHAFQRIVELVPEAHCLHAGHGPLEEDMTLWREKLPDFQKKHIHLLGLRRDIFRLLAVSDVFLLCSEQEGMPNAVMEAMRSGLPVVATRAGGTGELVQEEKTGFLLEVGDIAGLAEKTVFLLHNPILRKEMGRAGKKRLKAFSFAALLEREQAAYRKQLDRRGRQENVGQHIDRPKRQYDT
ncbi:MAG: glycosyltransferase [Desulfovibrionaceae bacterium]|nr:glycosyltransferase [Desulfovibrionaceae bacterium]